MNHEHPLAPHFDGDPTPPFVLPNGLGKLVRAMPAADWCGGWAYRVEWADGIARPAMLACSANDIDVLLTGGTLMDAQARSIGDARVSSMLQDLRRMPLSEAVLTQNWSLMRQNGLTAMWIKPLSTGRGPNLKSKTRVTPAHTCKEAA